MRRLCKVWSKIFFNPTCDSFSREGKCDSSCDEIGEEKFLCCINCKKNDGCKYCCSDVIDALVKVGLRKWGNT